MKIDFDSLDYLITSRPTAVNIAYDSQKIKEFMQILKGKCDNHDEFLQKYCFFFLVKKNFGLKIKPEN